jgi:hypothetical protein
MTYHLKAAYHNDQPIAELRTREDIASFVKNLLAAGWEHTAASVYAVADGSSTPPDHEMLVGVNGDTGVGAVRYAGNGDWYSHGDRTNPDGVIFAYFGTGHEFPADAEVPLDLVREAMWELMTMGGRRPSCVAWQEDAW